MKIAYIGYDLSSCQTAATLIDGHEVQYFIKEKNQNLNFSAFTTIDILTTKILIPAFEKQRTAAHISEFKQIESNYNLLKKILTPAIDCKSVTPKGDGSIVADAQKNVLDLSSIVDIQYDNKSKRINIEIENKGLETFDILFTEAHPLICDYLETKKMRLIKNKVLLKYVWKSFVFTYEFLKPIDMLKVRKEFFLVLDSSRDSLIDNWFYCILEPERIQVCTFQPFHQINNPEFFNFYVERIRQSLVNHFPFIQIKNFSHSQLATVGSSLVDISTLMPQSLIVPNFYFWKKEHIHDYLSMRLVKLTRKIKVNAKAAL